MEFKKYQHIERIGRDETNGLLCGTCYVFPKLDGTNGSIWYDGTHIQCGSRNRELTAEKDNRGFHEYVTTELFGKLYKFFKIYPSVRLYGEWLVPNNVRTYNSDAWRKFYVFDVQNEDGTYWTYDDYYFTLGLSGIPVIPKLAVIDNPTMEQLEDCMNHNTYLIQPDMGVGEGIVVKQYGYHNIYGRPVWGKMIHSEYKAEKERSHKAKAAHTPVEIGIIDTYVTGAVIDKEKYKIIEARDEIQWKDNMLVELFGRVYHTLLTEDTADFVKKYKKPTVDFNLLYKLVIDRVKEHLGYRR